MCAMANSFLWSYRTAGVLPGTIHVYYGHQLPMVIQGWGGALVGAIHAHCGQELPMVPQDQGVLADTIYALP